jgi:tetratricopeptide (TPR) repeat protein
MSRFLDRALQVAPADPNTRMALALIDLETGGDTDAVQQVIHNILAEDPSAVEAIAEQWLYVALCRRDTAGMASALASLSADGIIPFNVRMPRSFCEGLVARTRGDRPATERAFAATCVELQAALDEQPDYAQGWCVLAMANAGLGRKEDALTQGRRAAELLPVSRDAMTGSEILRNLAIIYAWTGEKDLAIKQLEELLPLYGPISHGQLKLHPWWDPIRDDPRFGRIMEEAKKPVALQLQSAPV